METFAVLAWIVLIIIISSQKELITKHGKPVVNPFLRIMVAFAFVALFSVIFVVLGWILVGLGKFMLSPFF